MTQAAHGKNDHRFDDLVKEAETYGADRAKGEDSLVLMALKAIQGAFDGYVTTNKDTHGPGVDDAEFLQRKYEGMRNASAKVQRTTSQKGQASKLRCVIRLGEWPHGGVGEPMNTINLLIDTYNKLSNDKTYEGKLESAYRMLQKFAAAQVRLKAVIPEDELKGYALKKEGIPKNLEEYIEAIAHNLQKLVDGKAVKGTIKDDSGEIVDALDALKSRLADLRNPEVSEDEAEDTSAEDSAARRKAEAEAEEAAGSGIDMDEEGNLTGPGEVTDEEIANDDELDEEAA
jgi:hypothetical protein